MMTRNLFLILIVLSGGSCARNNQVQEKIEPKFCCLEDLSFHSDYGSLSPDYITIKLLGCDSVMTNSIKSVVFPQITIEDEPFYNLWASEIKSPDTLILTVAINTIYFEEEGLSKDSIEHLLLKKVGLITKQKDTIYVERCPKDPIQ